MPNRTVYRYEVDVDNKDHEIEITGTLVQVGVKDNPAKVHFWTLAIDQGSDSVFETKTYRVFGTGQSVPEQYQYVGSANYVNYRLVWHLFEKVS